MKNRISSVYENIQHSGNSSAKVMINRVRSSTYHWHYDYELFVVLKGRIEVLYGLYGPEPQVLSEGDIILINPKDVHSFRGVDLNNLCLVIQFPAESFGTLSDGMRYFFFLNSTDPSYTVGQPYVHFVQLAARMAMAGRMNTGDAVLRKNAWLYMLLSDLLGSVPYEIRSGSLSTEEDATLVMEISGFVDQHLEDENIPNAVYRHFGLSEKSVYLLLKEVVGMSLKEMIDVSRVERACSLLQDLKIPMQVISDRCGYSGEATFYRRFKAAMGITPGEYRKGAETQKAGTDVQDYLAYDELGADELLKKWAMPGYPI